MSCGSAGQFGEESGYELGKTQDTVGTGKMIVVVEEVCVIKGKPLTCTKIGFLSRSQNESQGTF